MPIQAVDTHRPKPKRDAKGAPDTATDEPAGKNNMVRDYFGNAAQHVFSPQEAGPGKGKSEGVADAVRAALEKDQDRDLLTPKAVQGP